MKSNNEEIRSKINVSKDYQLADSFCFIWGYMTHPTAL